MDIDNLIKVLQASIAPVVLISGVGLLLLSLTNRLGRSIDRVRILCSAYGSAPQGVAVLLKQQIDILYQRCQMLRISIALSTASIGCVSVIILALFSMYIFDVNLVGFVQLFFAAGLISLILSLVFFLMDIRFALSSLKIEIDNTYRSKKG
ncbi:MAG: hypothetical protein A2787_06375 [Omnitrophica WOR_2 bacterium RIFCSPHIGHO2_01_FULL_48_9]|nr:MAG: hypothetical protein A3D10_02155 [Omnitrophica WOR_2 bacterium RIFCSPHIGHO2_02_FULL_48_11]OGX33122.1 MAG: hypothetical protein A2787_06375 [Omnitrophica WOR_2 bacterium RIFCSPHIGHO2_01_FULL_48_9]